MDRRTFINAVAGGLVAMPFGAKAQQARRIPRIGILTLSVAPSMPAFEGFRQGLRDHGYVEGQNIVLEFRFAQGRPERLPAMAAELVQMKVDVIVIEGTAQAAKDASGAIPIVMAAIGDPVGAGLVASLARPGGNITGLSNEVAQPRAQPDGPVCGFALVSFGAARRLACFVSQLLRGADMKAAKAIGLAFPQWVLPA